MMRVKAYAKVNLFLEITGKRPDGYHTLSTVFQTISLADEIALRPSPDLRLACSDATLPVDERNLAMRAAIRLLGERVSEKASKRVSNASPHSPTRSLAHSLVHITLTKNIPLGAGLGGGSSDAAAVLIGLSKFWRRRLPTSALQRCAKGLGADVPFFLTGGTCLGQGIGDRIKKLPALPKTWLVLVYPGFGVSTREAYARVRLPVKGLRSVHRFIKSLPTGNKEWPSQLFNRFEEFVFPQYPELSRIKQGLLQAGARGALMSGSGSTVFGVAATEAQGREILAQFRKKYPQSWLVHTL